MAIAGWPSLLTTKFMLNTSSIGTSNDSVGISNRFGNRNISRRFLFLIDQPRKRQSFWVSSNSSHEPLRRFDSRCTYSALLKVCWNGIRNHLKLVIIIYGQLTWNCRRYQAFPVATFCHWCTSRYYFFHLFFRQGARVWIPLVIQLN